MTGADEARAPAPTPHSPEAAGLFISDGFVVPGTGLEPIPPRRRRLRDSRLFVCLMLFAVLGPFALPLLWRSRAFSRRWKVALALAVLGLTAGLVVETVVYFPQFVEWGRRIGEAMQQR